MPYVWAHKSKLWCLIAVFFHRTSSKLYQKMHLEMFFHWCVRFFFTAVKCHALRRKVNIFCGKKKILKDSGLQTVEIPLFSPVPRRLFFTFF